ncbi:MAG: NAD-dependent epimerase/dehydratase family protein [Planctomycetales bacterium]|nr:NAD-dependent epimerase/dehydratase family protein [Planctomycetales bacterium]
MVRRAFVTGITGFAGAYLAERLLGDGVEVLGCSQHGVWPSFASDDVSRRVPVVRWDVTEAAPHELIERLRAFAPDWFVHLAALSIPADCGREQPTAEAMAVNVEGTRRVCELAASLAAPPRFLMVSTCYVYRPVSQQCAAVDESWPLGPTNGYGITKLEGEAIVRHVADRAAMPWIVARAFQHSGPGQPPRLLLPEWARQFALGTNPVEVRSLNSYLDLSDVRDIAAAYYELLLHGQASTAYNVGSGRCLRTGEVFEHLRARHDPARQVIETAPARIYQPIADIGRLTHDTPWRPQIPIEQTIDDTLQYWLTESSK